MKDGEVITHGEGETFMYSLLKLHVQFTQNSERNRQFENLSRI